MEIVVSGLRPTGPLHLGNYFGAIRNFLRMQEQYDCRFFVADLHSLTTHPNPADLQQNVHQLMLELLACGVDPEKATLFVQSDIPEISELYLIFNMMAYKGELERVPTFKEKVRKHPDNVNAGLLTYPVLMAVDIIIHRASKVPVGKDQEQHLEMTRNFVNRFNHLYNTDFFPEPEAFNFGQQLVKIPGLDGSGKMGKSEGGGNAVFLADSSDEILYKVKRAVTDSGPTEPNSPVSEPVQNLFDLMAAVSDPETLRFFRQAYADCSIRYGDLKKQLAEDMIKFASPIRERILELEQKPQWVKEIRQAGKEKARKAAKETLQGVRDIIGLSFK
jgi:tryptophanyl-tRNA synthetase